MFKNKKVLVTGGAGFIGSHLVDKLVELGADVTVLDNLSTGSLENLRKSQNKINFINGDITNYKVCINACENQEIIFHLAAMVSVPESIENPILCYTINVNGTINLLEAAKNQDVKKFIFSSSSAVYGATEGINKETDECNPISPYGLSKLIGENYCSYYAKFFDTVSLRYFNVYGDRQRDDSPYSGVIARFRAQMQKNAPITIFGDGEQMRDFIHVSNVVNYNLKATLLKKEFLNGQPFNIASGKSKTILELVEELKSEYKNYRAEVLFKPARQGDIKVSLADCSKIINFIA